MSSPIKALSFQSLIYGTGHILARLITFLLLPLYTNVFSPEEYAVVSLAYLFMGFMVVVLHYGLDAALMKHYVPAGSEERRGYLTNAYASFLISSIAFAVLMIILRRLLTVPLLGVYAPKYVVLIGFILMLDILWSVPMLLLRSEEKPLTVIGFSMLNVILSLGLNLLLVLRFRLGVDGVLLSNLWTSTVIFLVTLPVVIRRINPRLLAGGTWKKLMRFGLPFLPSGIFAMVMEMTGRYLLKFMTDMETVGIYSAGYKLGMLMLLVVMGFNMAWQPFFLRQGGSEDQKQLYRRIASLVLAVLGFVWVFLLLWTSRLVRLPIGDATFYGREFWSSTAIVPWIAMGYFFQATYLLQLPGPFLTEKSKWVAYTRGIGATATIILNLALIPFFGAMGAAVAMCVSYLIMSGTLYFVNRRIFPMNFEWWRIIRIGVILIAIFVARDYLPERWFVAAGLTVAYPVLLIISGFFKRRDFQALGKIFSR